MVKQIVILLLIASVVSLALGEYAAAAVIIIIVMANAILGVVQETRAEAALDELKSVSADKADVQRDGKRCEVPATELVPGDIVYLDMGCQIPVCYPRCCPYTLMLLVLILFVVLIG
jgi:Ca2+-transporting ATPase